MKIRTAPFWIGFALTALFGVRAITGVLGGVAFARGSAAASQGYYDLALPHLEKAAVGFNRYEALWLAAEVRTGIYDMLQQVPDSGEEQDLLLQKALEGYRAAAASCPVSGWSWEGMSGVYFRMEERRQAAETPDLARLALPPWERLGAEGRTAFGFLRWAIEKEPGIYTFRDKLVMRSLRFGLKDEARIALAEAATHQPDFWRHTELRRLDDPELLAVFAAASEEALDQAPLISRERHLFSLGKLYHRLQDLPRAEAMFRAARREPATAIKKAEDAFHLALVLKDQDRYDEALLFLDEAARNEAFRFAVYSNRADIARRQGRLELAFDYLNRCRRMAPRSTRYALGFAQVAVQLERFDAAEQSLKWACIIDPGNSVVWSELAQFYINRGEYGAVRSALRDAGEELGPDHPELLDLARKLAARLNTRDTTR